MRLGDLELLSLTDGFFALDGGAMFGVVPKVLWQRTNPPDDRNRVRLAMRPLLIRARGALVLVDTGIGRKQDAKFQDMYKVEHTNHLVASLEKAGWRPEEVTHVVNTHLHFDHSGGNTKRVESGRSTDRLVPAFPNAKYYIQRREWEAATRPDMRSRASYLQENFIPIQEAGQLELLDGDKEVAPGVTVVLTGGHTNGHQLVILEAEGTASGTRTEDNAKRKAIYWGDLIPTTTHVKVPYVMAYDTMPLVTMEQKEKLLKLVADEHWLMFFEHDPAISSGHLVEERGKYAVRIQSADGLTQISD